MDDVTFYTTMPLAALHKYRQLLQRLADSAAGRLASSVSIKADTTQQEYDEPEWQRWMEEEVIDRQRQCEALADRIGFIDAIIATRGDHGES